MAKNIYLIDENMLSVMSNHEQIEIQIKLAKVLNSYKKGIDRVFKAIAKMSRSEQDKYKTEIEDSINCLDRKCMRYDIGIESVLNFWKGRGEYEKIYYNLRDRGFDLE